jgi:hypothetical protein
MLKNNYCDAGADRCQPDMPRNRAYVCCLIYVSSRDPSVAVRDSDTQTRVDEDDWYMKPQIRG